MLFGHNTNVTVADKTYHVQTEDRGTGHAILETTVYWGGRVMHRRTNSYGDLLPLDPKREQALKSRLDEQHEKVLEELRSGSLKFVYQGVASSGAARPAAPVAGAQARSISLELLNGKAWLASGRATLQVAVRAKENGAAIPGARVIARIDGAATPTEFSTATGAEGRAQLAFDMPRLSGAEPALVIEARYGESQGILRFQLRAKPKVPAAG